jgi:hypothetical protein
MSPYDAKKVADMRAEEAVRRMHYRRLVREATANQEGWAVRQIAPLLRRSGELLVAAGRRLQQVGARQKSPIEGQARARALINS